MKKPKLPVAERLKPLFEIAPPPDVIAIYEVEGATVWRDVMAGFPGYSFFTTEGENTQQILVGVGPEVTGFMTQKLEFKEYNPFLRPGALLTVRPHASAREYALLFLHLKSMSDAGGFGGRTDMIDRAFKFKGVLEDAVGGTVDYIFLGDLNTMGLDYPFARQSDGHLAHAEVSAEQEVSRLRYLAAGQGMRVLDKTAPATWGDPKSQAQSNLDHVIATEGIAFIDQGGAEVRVLGWPEEQPDKRGEWMLNHSDHGILFFQIDT